MTAEPRQFTGPSARDIAEALRGHAEAIGFMLFPAARKAGGFLNVGSLYGEPGDSLKIRLNGPKRGTWADYATSPGDPRGMGDMLKLLQLTLGAGDLKAGVEAAKKFLNLDTMDPRAMERMRLRAEKARARAEREAIDERDAKRRQAEGMWISAATQTPAMPPIKYLEGRGIDFSVLGHLPGAIRFYPKLVQAELSERAGTKMTCPAMVTKATDVFGRHAATHVTYLSFQAGRGWVKLPPVEIEQADPATGEVTIEAVECAKKIFGPWHSLGAHASLHKGDQPHRKLADVKAGTPIYVSEGAEDGLSYAMADPSARVIMAGTLGNIAKLVLPPQAGDLVLLAQNDTKEAALAAREAAIKAQELQARQQGSDRKVRLKLPPPIVKDWNDWLRLPAVVEGQ